MSGQMASLSGVRKLASLFALLFTLAFYATGEAQAATVDVTDFNAVLVTTPTTMHKLWYRYNGSWSDSNRRGLRNVDWFQNNTFNQNISTGTHFTSPFNVEITEYTTPRSSGSGNYYKVTASIYDTITFQTYATSNRQDGDFSN